MAKLGRRRSGDVSGREVLLQSALHWFSRNGFEAASLRKIAQDAQVDVALVNRLFGSKKELWYAVVEELKVKQAANLSIVKSISEEENAPSELKINRYLDLIVDISFDVPELSAFILQEILNPGERLDHLKTELIKPFITESISLINECNRDRVIKCIHPDLYIRMALSSVAQLIDYSVLYEGDSVKIGNMKSKILYETKKVFISI